MRKIDDFELLHCVACWEIRRHTHKYTLDGPPATVCVCVSSWTVYGCVASEMAEVSGEETSQPPSTKTRNTSAEEEYKSGLSESKHCASAAQIKHSQ